MQGMACLITGVAGFVGSTLAGRLLDDGHTVIGIDCFTGYYDLEQKRSNISTLMPRKQFTFVEADIAGIDLSRYLKGVDWVFHQAAQPGVRASWGDDFVHYVRHNVAATQRLLEAVKEMPIRRLVYASSSSVYGDSDDLPLREDSLPKPISPYGVTKLAAEHLCNSYHKCYGVPCVSLRYFTVYGPRQRPDMAFHKFIRAALTDGRLVINGDGQQTRDFTFINDIVEANISAATVPGVEGGVFNIGGGSRVTVNHVLEVIRRLVDRPLDVAFGENQKGDVRHTHADTSAAQTSLGYRPQVGLEDGLSAEVEWMRTKIKA